MVDLPTEIIIWIFRLAATVDVQTAYQLCLVNRLMRKAILPSLYRHVCLSYTEQVKQFNATIKSSPHIKKYINGITLLDDDVYGDTSDDEIAAWSQNSKVLLETIGTLSKDYKLETIVLSRGMCNHFEYICRPVNEWSIPKQTLTEPLGKWGICIDHLVVSHGNLDFYMQRFNARKITYCGCEGPMADSDLNTSAIALYSRRLQQIDFFIGDKVIDHSEEFAIDPDNAARYRMQCSREFVYDLKTLLKTVSTRPKIRVFLHRKSQITNLVLKKALAQLDCNVVLGLWGQPSASEQYIAEDDSFFDRGWIHKRGTTSGFSRDHVYGKEMWCDCGPQQDLIYKDESSEDDKENHEPEATIVTQAA